MILGNSLIRCARIEHFRGLHTKGMVTKPYIVGVGPAHFKCAVLPTKLKSKHTSFFKMTFGLRTKCRIHQGFHCFDADAAFAMILE